MDMQLFLADGCREALLEEKRRFCFLVDKHCTLSYQIATFHDKVRDGRPAQFVCRRVINVHAVLGTCWGVGGMEKRTRREPCNNFISVYHPQIESIPKSTISRGFFLMRCVAMATNIFVMHSDLLKKLKFSFSNVFSPASGRPAHRQETF